MTLRELLGSGPETEIASLAYDNRTVTPGAAFFCVSGFTSDGHDFAPDAIARGAVALVVSRPLGLGVPEVLVPDVRAAMAIAAVRFYADPSDRIDVVGVTGTSGKTTTTFLVCHLVEAAGSGCGLLGGVTTIVGGEHHPAVRTTPEAIDVQERLAAMLAGGDRACAMEVSSHALELRRVDGIRFAVAAFTNLSQDHLDFHPDMESYFAAKLRLFEEFEIGCAIVSIDDDWGSRLAAMLPDATTVSLAGGKGGAPSSALRGLNDRSRRCADWTVDSLEPGLDGSRFRVLSPAGQADVVLPLRGRFNVSNALLALAAGDRLGLDLAEMAAALGSAPVAPGRAQAVATGRDFALLVDYAHKPGALESILRAARELAGGGRVLVVFGAGGDRDRAKRPLMGEVAARLADLSIVTSDNPRSEDPEAIISAIVAGAAAGAAVERIIDRRAAIERAITVAGAGDVIVIAGKGHERGQEFADGRREPFDDVEVAMELLGG